MNLIFISALTGLLFFLLAWGFKYLPHEEYQIIGSIPGKYNHKKGTWNGTNLTYYGVLQSNSYLISVLLFIILLGSINVPLPTIFIISGIVFSLCIPSASVIAKMVEKKSYTFTVGGASFVGIMISPVVCLGINYTSGFFLGKTIDILPVLSAMAIGYALGEGVGRLACISFGCCYGKPLSETPQWVQILFKHFNFKFTGKNKKISYADELDGEKVVPVQGITAALYSSSAVIGTCLFLNEYYYTSFVMMIMITQVWRFFSEFLRADYRGNLKISAYQIMGIIGCLYAIVIPFFIPSPSSGTPDIVSGVKQIWHPAIILSLQVLWIGVFLHTGRSRVTGSTLSFFVNRDRI